MKIFNYLQEYKREKPVNQQDKLTQKHYTQTEHSPKSQQKRYFISHDKVRIIYFQSSVLVRAMPSLTPVSYTHLDENCSIMWVGFSLASAHPVSLIKTLSPLLFLV